MTHIQTKFHTRIRNRPGHAVVQLVETLCRVVAGWIPRVSLEFLIGINLQAALCHGDRLSF
jgi:hypothetical protein